MEYFHYNMEVKQKSFCQKHKTLPVHMAFFPKTRLSRLRLAASINRWFLYLTSKLKGKSKDVSMHSRLSVDFLGRISKILS